MFRFFVCFCSFVIFFFFLVLGLTLVMSFSPALFLRSVYTSFSPGIINLGVSPLLSEVIPGLVLYYFYSPVIAYNII